MGKSNLLKTTWRGTGIWEALADTFNLIGLLLNNITCDGNDAEVTRTGIKLRSNAKPVSFTGVYWFEGVRYTINMANKKAYWYHDKGLGAGVWSDGPMKSPMDENTYWRETATCRPVEYINC